MTERETKPISAPVLEHGGKLALYALLPALVGFGVMAWGFGVAPKRAFHAYLAAYAFVLSAALGSLAFTAIAHAANTTWPVAVRRLPEAIAPALPCLALLFVPLLFGLGWLYPWADPSELPEHARKLVEHRRSFMNASGFGWRAGGYLLFWSVIALALRRQSIAMERGRDPEACARGARRLSYAALPLLALSVAIAGFEWIMSLSPEYSSTMFGALWIAVCLYSGVATIVVLLGFTQGARAPLPSTPSHYSALGRLLFAFLIFLGYAMFFQFLLGWIGNRPSEAEWYRERSHGAYYFSVLFLLFGHFGVTFFSLLSFRLKRRIERLRVVGLWALASQYVLTHWLIIPAGGGPAYSVFDLAALVAVACITVSFCLWAQRGKSLAPSFDPRYAASLAYQSR